MAATTMRKVEGATSPTASGVPGYADRPSLRPREFQQKHRMGNTSFYKQVAIGALTLKKVGRSSIVTAEAEDAWLASLPEKIANAA